LLDEGEDEDSEEEPNGERKETEKKETFTGLRSKRSYVDRLRQRLRLSGHRRKNAKNFEDPFI